MDQNQNTTLHMCYFLLSFLLVTFVISCSDDSSDDGTQEDNTILIDGDEEQEEFSQELDDYTPHEPDSCDINHCQSRTMVEGTICVVDTSEIESIDPDHFLSIATSLIECGKAANDCPIELSQTPCEYGCDFDNNVCFTEPAKMSGTITREETPEPIVANGAAGSLFSGQLWIHLFTEQRQGNSLPLDSLVAGINVKNIDLTDAQASVAYEGHIIKMEDRETPLAAGTYYAEAWLVGSDVTGPRVLTNGELLVNVPIEVTADTDGNIQADVHLNASWDDSIGEE